MNDDPFDSVSAAADETALTLAMREYEARFFPGVKPVVALEVKKLDGPARFVLAKGTIEINPSVAGYPRVARILILHELINNKLVSRQGGKLDVITEEEIQSEVDRLWASGAYKLLL